MYVFDRLYHSVQCSLPIWEFSSASIGGPSVYEEYQQAQDMLANINLPKLVHNLHPLEVAFTAHTEGKKREMLLARWNN